MKITYPVTIYHRGIDNTVVKQTVEKANGLDTHEIKNNKFIVYDIDQHYQYFLKECDCKYDIISHLSKEISYYNRILKKLNSDMISINKI